jgi:pSer/pThr/pTyr-binding forkhead associated (FHA) protein
MFCSECGFRNREGARYCTRCGAALVDAPDDAGSTVVMRPDEGADTQAVPPSSRPGAGSGGTLTVHQGGGREGERFELDGEAPLSLGRDPDSDLFFDDVTVSRRHALLEPSPEGIWIRDCGSLNGTYVNRRRIERVLLDDGDEVQVGKYRLTFLAGRT